MSSKPLTAHRSIDLAHAEGGYQYSANVSLTALLTTNGDADLCIRMRQTGLAHIGMSTR